MVANFLTAPYGIFRPSLVVGFVLCSILPGWAAEHSSALSRDKKLFRSGVLTAGQEERLVVAQAPEDRGDPFRDEEPSPFFSEEAIYEEDLPSKVLPAYGREERHPLSEDEFSPDSPSYSFPSDRERFRSSDEQSETFGHPSVPERIPPFMSRPFEWEKKPPTVIGMPPLPPLSDFSNREFVALTFIEEGKAHFDRGEWELAQAQFERAISLAPFLPYGYYFLGRVAFAGKDLQSALAFLQKAELLFPRSEHAWLGETTSVKGSIYEDLKDYPQARETYKRSLRFQPANLKVLSALARLPEEEPPFREPFP